MNKEMKARTEAEEEQEQYWEIQQREPRDRDTVAGKKDGVWTASWGTAPENRLAALYCTVFCTILCLYY